MHGFIELPNTGEAGGKGNGSERQTSLINQQTSRLSATCTGQRQRADSNLGHEFAPQMPLTHTEALRKSRHAFGIHCTIGD
ncbi:hypothetical protein KSZ_53630 [Dictyobacter formicarum]|uniref:Uncharacterized protein n=1 Tax=Dictyobacter formicarum TaxID=2778368 RepID=A0ABQ3VMB7_9CHLR|nr:hypothetical protein KSZ_53630 [Dictyobacter formicarum]